MAKRRPIRIGDMTVRAGQTCDIRLKVSETYTGDPIVLPVRVQRARRPGPRVFLTAAVHGDEINGVGVIRELLFGHPPALLAGTLVCVPVVNIFGFETHSRYMPDRRDLNRSFPGSPDGSLASRIAHTIHSQIICQCDYGIDLHTAAVHRTNFPNVRGNLATAEVKHIAAAFGCELMMTGKGPEGSLRRAACDAGCPTIILEAGEVMKIEPSVLELGIRGVRNVLIELGMLPGEIKRPAFQTVVARSTWVRAELGGLLRFYVAPGDLVEGGQPIADNQSVFGEARSTLIAPVDGIVQGMTTHPAVKPGEPVCHIAVPRKSLRSIRKALDQASQRSLPHRVRQDLATNITVATEGGS